MLSIILYEPEVPSNTSNVIRLCVNTGFRLHIIRPIGPAWDDKRLHRVGLGCHELIVVTHHHNYRTLLETENPQCLSTPAMEDTPTHNTVGHQDSSYPVFSPETHGLLASILDALPTEQKIRTPVISDSRSVNLSNAMSVVMYEA